MPKGIRKACANCIKARLACDEGRPCQRCLVHQCECVPVARKPRVKKQKLDDIPLDKTEPGGLSWIQSDPSSFIEPKADPIICLSPPLSLSPTISTPSPPPQQPVPILPVQAPVIIIPSAGIPSPQEECIPILTPSYVPLLPQYTPQPLYTGVQSPPQLESVMSPVNMLSLLLDEKSSEGAEWPDMSQPGMTEFVNDCIESCFKKPAAPAPLPQPKNSTPLFPAPIGIFDKSRFLLLDTNMAMANLLGYNNVAELALGVNCLDDLVDPTAAHMAKNATTFFVANMPFDRMAVLRTPSGGSKTVEFRVDLTEQLLILTVKSVFDDCFMAVPEVPLAPAPVKCSTAEYQPSEFLAPID